MPKITTGDGSDIEPRCDWSRGDHVTSHSPPRRWPLSKIADQRIVSTISALHRR